MNKMDFWAADVYLGPEELPGRGNRSAWSPKAGSFLLQHRNTASCCGVKLSERAGWGKRRWYLKMNLALSLVVLQRRINATIL